MLFDTLRKRFTHVQLHHTHLIPLLAGPFPQTFSTISFQYSTFRWFAYLICITYAADLLPSLIQHCNIERKPSTLHSGHTERSKENARPFNGSAWMAGPAHKRNSLSVIDHTLYYSPFSCYAKTLLALYPAILSLLYNSSAGHAG